MRDTGGQPADRRHGLCLAQPLLGLPARVTSVYSVTKPPPGSGLRLISSCRPPGRGPLDRAHGAAGAQQRHAPRDLSLDVDRAELAARHLRAQNLLHRQADV